MKLSFFGIMALQWCGALLAAALLNVWPDYLVLLIAGVFLCLLAAIIDDIVQSRAP